MSRMVLLCLQKYYIFVDTSVWVKEAKMTCAWEPAKTYEQCLAEIQALRQDPEYDILKDMKRHNTAQEVTPEMFQMSDEFLEGWANKVEGLFATKLAFDGRDS